MKGELPIPTIAIGSGHDDRGGSSFSDDCAMF